MKKKLSILLALAVIIAALTLSVSAAGVVEPVPITPNMSQEEVCLLYTSRCVEETGIQPP